MNLIKELDKIAVDIAITEHPFKFIIFQELYLDYNNDYKPTYLGDYDEIFNKISLSEFFEGKITYEEMLKPHNLAKYELKDQQRMFPLINARLDVIKELDRPVYNKEKLIILKAIVESNNQYISLPYLMRSLHKNELLTLLSITEWNYDFVTVSGWGVCYTAISFEITSIFPEIVELEVYLPYEEINKLIQQLPNYKNSESLKQNLEYTKKYNDKAEEMLKRINDDQKQE